MNGVLRKFNENSMCIDLYCRLSWAERGAMRPWPARISRSTQISKPSPIAVSNTFEKPLSWHRISTLSMDH
jgi:hypothetical protein